MCNYICNYLCVHNYACVIIFVCLCVYVCVRVCVQMKSELQQHAMHIATRVSMRTCVHAHAHTRSPVLLPDKQAHASPPQTFSLLHFRLLLEPLMLGTSEDREQPSACRRARHHCVSVGFYESGVLPGANSRKLVAALSGTYQGTHSTVRTIRRQF